MTDVFSKLKRSKKGIQGFSSNPKCRYLYFLSF